MLEKFGNESTRLQIRREIKINRGHKSEACREKITPIDLSRNICCIWEWISFGCIFPQLSNSQKFRFKCRSEWYKGFNAARTYGSPGGWELKDQKFSFEIRHGTKLVSYSFGSSIHTEKIGELIITTEILESSDAMLKVLNKALWWYLLISQNFEEV